MTSPLRQRGDQGMRLGNPSVTLSTCDPKHPTLLQPKGEGSHWESSMFHKQNLSDELLPRMTGDPSATAPRMSHLGVGHVNTSSKSMDGLNSNQGGLSAEHPTFARTRQYRSMSNEDMKTQMLPPKRLPGEPTNYMEAAAAELQSGKGSSIIDNLMKEYRSGNLYARQPADLLLPSAKEDPTQMKTDLSLHRENSAPQLSASREWQMKSPPEYPGHSRFAQNFDLTPSSTPRASSPLSLMSDMDFPTARSNRSMFSSRDSSVFGDFDTGLSTRSRGRVHSPFSTMKTDFEKGAPPPEYPGFKRTPWQSHSGREFRSRKESATVDHSRASSFGSYQHSLNLKRLSSETSYDSSRAR
ncbi:uncharacterized protein LOC129278507 [Lytechinus pictus]|uniref:uncharacterized protein LOC129278507 n=1 Tax=Lytechinus pictus TaxID=7653 RepID=UPI0030B9FB39